MAGSYRSISRPAVSLLRSAAAAAKKPCTPHGSLPRPSPSFQRVPREMGALMSLLPLHSAVSASRLTSRLGVDVWSRSLSQGTICSSNPGV